MKDIFTKLNKKEQLEAYTNAYLGLIQISTLSADD